ncbi:hypothetical protein STENM36S_08633 [Streptomyces tendae]
MSRQRAGTLINGDRRPTMEHCDAIQRFFRVRAGFLTAEDPEALAGALQRTEQELLQQLADREREAAAADDPLERLLQDHGVRGIAWRAAQLHRPAPRQGRRVAGHAPGERQAARVLSPWTCLGRGPVTGHGEQVPAPNGAVGAGMGRGRTGLSVGDGKLGGCRRRAGARDR